MKTKYNSIELKRGKCPNCLEMSNEILIEDRARRCIACIATDDFAEQMMTNLIKY